MGLDISAYRKLTKIDVTFDADDQPIDRKTGEPLDDYYRVYANPDFPGRESGLVDRAVYGYEDSEHVFSRSYGGYNRWREELAKLAGYPKAERVMWGVKEDLHAMSLWSGQVTEGPFYELINFADNEGTIGPVVAAKLLRDFIEWDDRAKAVEGHPYFYQGYSELRRGLEMAADGGALDFH